MDRRLILLLVALPWFASSTAAAQPVAVPFPAGKSVSLHVGSEPGGANDLAMRLVARHIGKYLPGRPTVIPRNTPGAGGRRLAAFLYNAAARDGTEFGEIQRSVTLDQLLIDSSLPFKMQELTWIGTPSGATDTCFVWHTARAQSLAALQATELVIAGAGNEAAQVLILQRLTGARIRVVHGYPSGASMNMALERGEAEGRCSVSWEAIKSAYADWLRDKKVKVLVQYALSKHPELSDVPLITDFATSAVDQQALAVLMLPQEFGFPFAAPPGLLPQVSAMLRDAFAQTMQDPQLIEEAARFKVALNPKRGEHLQRLIRDAHAASPATIERAKQLIAPN
jgi:tripartite-type tricarboxylate transporter receptor subunit TctC